MQFNASNKSNIPKVKNGLDCRRIENIKILKAVSHPKNMNLFVTFCIKNVIAVAAYIRLTSRSQAKFPDNEIESHSTQGAQPHLRRVPPDVHFDSHLASDRMRI